MVTIAFCFISGFCSPNHVLFPPFVVFRMPLLSPYLSSLLCSTTALLC